MFTVIHVSGVFILIVLCPFSLIGCAGLVGISLASRVTYIFVCVSLRCVERRAGTSIFGHSAGVGGGTVRFFFLFGSVLACAVRLDRWGWRDSTDYLVSLALFWRVLYD